MEKTTQRHIKDYELRERLGTGGFDAVYRAFQSTVGHEVAIKVILPGIATGVYRSEPLPSNVVLWDLETGTVTAIALSPDGSTFLSGDGTGTVL